MGKIRVLVVDDSVVVRRFVSDTLDADPRLEVVGTAPNGRIALSKIPLTSPDVVILDLEMPEMDGRETIAEIRKRYPTLSVILFSQLPEAGARASLDALRLGANDFVAKPSGDPRAGALESAATELVSKVKALGAHCRTDAVREGGCVAPGTAGSAPLGGPNAWVPVELLVIGVSTGGPNALSTLLSALPADFPVPILVAQHMPPVFTRSLAERLTSVSSLKAREARNGELARAGEVVLAPGDYHMIAAKTPEGIRVHTHQGPPRNFCRPSVDVLFESAAATCCPGVLAVVLTGMGQDGLEGCRAIHARGGHILVQDEVSSVVWGMPGAVERAGLATKTVPLDGMAFEIAYRIKTSRNTPREP